MEKRTIKIHSFVIGTGLLEILILYAVYYFTSHLWISLVTSLLLNLAICHIILESSMSFDSEFTYMLITMLLSTACTLFIYFKADGRLLVYHKYLPALLFLQWFLPVLYSTFRSLFDRGPRFMGYRSFFLKASVVFFLYYAVVAAWELFLHPLVFPESASAVAFPYVPFIHTASYIQDYIYNGISILPLIFYIGKLFLLFLPLGFYVSLLLTEAPMLLKAACVIFVPCLFLNIPCFYGYSFHMDACLFGIIGYLAGCLLLQIANRIAHANGKNNFLSDRNGYAFFNMYY